MISIDYDSIIENDEYQLNYIIDLIELMIENQKYYEENANKRDLELNKKANIYIKWYKKKLK